MKAVELQVGKVYSLPTTYSENPNYYVVKTDEGNTFTIKKLRFQQTLDTPSTLSCLVKGVHDGQPFLLQDLTPYIRQFYKEGEVYSFRVKADYTRNNFYEIEDENGLFFRLHVQQSSLVIGQIIDCQIRKINGCNVQLELMSAAESVREIPFWPFCEIKEKVFGSSHIPMWIRRFIISEESTFLKEQYKMKNPHWLMNAISYLIDLIPSWFHETNIDYDVIIVRLRELRKVSQTLLEGSDYLAKCTDNERMTYRKTLSDMTSSVNHFIKASCMLKEGDYKEFIDKMFGNLKLSGYLYNPDKQFQTLNTILRIHPNFIHEWMGKIFDALTSWNIQNWKMEPFRSAFVRQTELYIRENQCVVDELVGLKSKKDIAVISKMIMALAIQMLIVEDGKDDININRNRALYYRYISSLNNVAQDALLDKAFHSVMGCKFKPEFTWDHLRQMEMMITLSGVKNKVVIPDNVLMSYFTANNALEISTKGITLKHGTPKNYKSVLPNGLLTWQKMQIFVDVDCKIKTPSATKMKDLAAFKIMWSDIDEILFPSKIVMTKKVQKISPEVGDVVKICVDNIVRNSENRLVCLCTIVDEVFEGSGVLNVRNIVRYNTEPSIQDFYDDESNGRMIFEAQVQGVNQEGRLAFNMLDQVDRCIENAVGYGEESRCVITSKQPNTFMCLSEHGYSVIVQREESTETFDIGHFVNVQVTESMAANKIKGEITSAVADDERFEPTLPIHNILQDVCIDVEDVENGDNDLVIQADETISYEQVEELIAIIRRLAFLSADYVQAYNYLGFARVLAKMVSRKDIVTLCSEHMELLILLQAFAKNRIVDVAEIEKHSLVASKNPMLNYLYSRLSVVANIGHPEYNQTLWDMLGETTSIEDASLIRNVLTLNLLKQNGGFESNTQNVVMEQIGKLLKLNFPQNSLKFYGTESQYIEFKSSIVFPADNHMKPDVSKQNYEIASVICGFLNSEGGTLYIGVNDQGYECGVDNDMEYYKVVCMDKYILKIESLIQKELGSTANDYITIDYDHDCKHKVAVLKIKPSLRAITMKSDGAIYVRHTTSTRPKQGEDIEIFKKDREVRYQQIVESLK